LFGPSHLAPKLQAEGYSIDDFKDGMETLFDSLGLDFIVIDTYAGLDERTLPLMAIADMLTVVMLLDKQDFQGTGVIVEIARKIDIPEICLIINSVTIAFEPDKVKAEAEQAYNCPVIAVVPHDMELLDPNRSRIVALDRLDRTIPATLVSVADRLIRAETEE
jgi:septum site-determining protein MinD